MANFQPNAMFFIKTNVAIEEDWERLIENTLDKYGRIDILVNNAGTSYRNKVRQISVYPINNRQFEINNQNSLQQKSQKMNSIKSLRST